MAFLLRFALALALAAVPSVLQAQDIHRIDRSPQLGTGIVCDTPQQVQRYLALHTDGVSAQTAMDKVNVESDNPLACKLVVTAFVENAEVAKVTVPDGILRLVQIMIFAMMTDAGWQRVPGAIRYTAVFVKTDAA